jgi:hypothetical protein
MVLKARGSQCVPQDVPNSTTLSSHMLLPEVELLYIYIINLCTIGVGQKEALYFWGGVLRVQKDW